MKSAGAIAAYGLIERFRLDLVKLGEIALQHHLLAANQIDRFLDSFNGDEVCSCEVLS